MGVTEDGRLTGAPNLGDLRFSQPESGWYWSVEPVSPEMSGPIRSASMTEAVASPGTNEIPFNADFQRGYVTDGLAGEQIQVFESEFELGARSLIARFRVMGNRTELDQEIGEFERRLFTYLALFGVGMIVINAVAILLGLQPINRVRNALSQIREGTAQRLEGSFPAEIEPLAHETNVLIDNNRRIVERSRTQVGNLAHSLKTPLAVMLNEARAIGGPKGALLTDQASVMQQQVEHYLRRARVAAQRDSVVYRTPVQPTLERIARVMEKLGRGTRLGLNLPSDPILFGGEREDLEEVVGNLLENAFKWAKSRVEMSLVSNRDAEAGQFAIVIEDDGPGIPEDKAREALKRGSRLDESKPGTGLGLAIVADLVNEYGGKLMLERSPLGGLKATIRLATVD